MYMIPYSHTDICPSPPVKGTQDLYWISVEEAGNLPAVRVDVNRVARARFGDVIVGGRELFGAFWGSLDGQQYISGSYEVSFSTEKSSHHFCCMQKLQCVVST